MALVDRMRRQLAVYWQRALDTNGQPINDDRGQPTFNSAVVIRVRWEDTAELYKTREGKELVGRAVVFVDRDMQDLLDYLWLSPLPVGTPDATVLAGLTSASTPELNKGASQVMRFDKIPSLKNQPNKTARIAYL